MLSTELDSGGHSVINWTVVDQLRTWPPNTRSGVYETVERPSVRLSVCLSHESTAAAASEGFASERPAGRIIISIDSRRLR